MDQEPLDPTEAFAELGRIKLNETDLDHVLGRIAELAKRTIPGADEVSVTLIPGKGPRTAAFTGELALALDERQYEIGAGPCLEAATTTATVSIPDLTREERWPDYRSLALDSGVHSALSVGLPVDQTVTGALNIYATKPDAFDDDAALMAQTFSGYAAVALANAHLYDVTATLAQHMQAAMESRAVIEQAKGIIMGDRHCTADEAFKILSKLSQDTNRKLRDVAEALVANAARGRG
ncbi:GAF and ANTAR domain-containing protein [Paractinoplanes toevensis]|uniref:GAF and ANTAR domain-containing protein n=1 Tax=Paractinoplanes toevensis TaxID=571911 RepID=UPI001BB40DC5|nr:GAF and ANTAR domain-containing protein [Actinoplanes toevensis]